MTIRLGANLIGWSNDDLQEIVGETSLETCLAEAREAGFVGVELGDTFPSEAAQLRARPLIWPVLADDSRSSCSSALRAKGFSGWVVLEAEQDPKKAPSLAYAKKGVAHLKTAFRESGLD